MPEGIDYKSDQKPNAHLGQGWAFPLQVNVQGGLQMSSAIRNVEESMQIILRTELGLCPTQYPNLADDSHPCPGSTGTMGTSNSD
jgi:hypothetical protein